MGLRLSFDRSLEASRRPFIRGPSTLKAFGKEATVDVLSEVVILRPRLVVAAFASDPDNAPLWYVNIKSVEWRTPKLLVVGSRIAFVATFLGRVLTYTYEITDLIPGERLVMQTAEGPFPMETSYTWATVSGDRTHMTLRNCGNPHGFLSLAAPFMAAAVRRANRKDLAKLQRVLEGVDQHR